MITSTTTLIDAMRKLAQDIESGDGLANMVIAEAADRLEELDKRAVALRGALVSLLVDPREEELELMSIAFYDERNKTDDEKRRHAAVKVLLTYPEEVQS